MAYKNTSERKWKVVILGSLTAGGFLVANAVGAFDSSPSVNPGPDRDIPPSPPGSSSSEEVHLGCTGIKGIRGDDRNLHVSPEIVGPLPPNSTMVYEAHYGNRSSGPIVGRALGETTIGGRPDEVEGTLLVGGDPKQPIPCKPWES